MEMKVVFHDGTELIAEYDTARAAAKASGRMAKMYSHRIGSGEWVLWGNVYPGNDDDYTPKGCVPYTNISVDMFAE